MHWDLIAGPNMPEKNPIFDSEMDGLIADLVVGGLTYQEIADFVGITRSMVFKLAM